MKSIRFFKTEDVACGCETPSCTAVTYSGRCNHRYTKIYCGCESPDCFVQSGHGETGDIRIPNQPDKKIEGGHATQFPCGLIRMLKIIDHGRGPVKEWQFFQPQDVLPIK